ncbi:MAG: NADH-quinone oxidoreductase subunit NuoF [Bacteroidales bacterium]|nr:NADH-quinone oxidoreductase subunit NuoF [Bacteroidales bacterium]
MADFKIHLLVCGGTKCRSSLSTILTEQLRTEIKNQGLDDYAQVVTTGCFGFCEKGPVIKIIPDHTIYTKVKPDDAEEIVTEHIVKVRKVNRLLYKDPKTDKIITDARGMEIYKKQIRIALRNCGMIDPESIEEYVARDGYAALGKALTSMTPEETIQVIKLSGLRGRGGAGFLTGLKWELTRQTHGDEKYVVCNADEGDPGAFMDRSILEGDPHSVIEAMAINGYCTGASQGLVYIRAEYPLAIERLKKAIQQAREYGMLGEDIFSTGFNFDISIRYGAGAFVCGEETALIHSMEGGRGEPTMKPPFPSVKGYLGKPTNVNNVETLANVPVIINKGHEWFSSIGTERSKGTKVFALAGKVNNVGLIEVPMGITLREVIFEIGGGIKNDKKFKGIQIGGPSGGCLTEKHLDVPIDYDSLVDAGAMMGSGGMIIMDEDDCMVDVAKYFLDFTVDESCGKCTPCRIGNKRLHELLVNITKGNGTEEDIERLINLASVIKDTSLCMLGQSAPNPVLSTLENFREEYHTHIHDKKCPAGVCKDLMKYEIVPENCVGCTACARACPVGAITGERKEIHIIDQSLCIKCGACMDRCKFNAVIIN